MKVKSVRIPDEIDKAIDYVARSEKLEKTSSLRKLTRMGFEVYVAKSYERGKLTLREAANLLNLNLIETIDLLGEMGVKGNIKSQGCHGGLKGPSLLTPSYFRFYPYLLQSKVLFCRSFFGPFPSFSPLPDPRC